LVEDHSDVRDALSVLMEHAGYTVVQAASAEEGMERLSAGRFDLVMTDYALPGKSGAWLLRESVRRGLVTPDRALIITAKEEVGDVEEFVVLRKPLDVDLLLDQVSRRIGSAASPTASTAGPALPATVELALYISAGSRRSQDAVVAEGPRGVQSGMASGL
jgi:DNA-binding NtrC family response regulator